MAKAGGINVTKFCIGFGRRLFGFKYKGTEYRWNLLPLGGYVDFMGDLVYTGKIPDDVTHFYNRPKWIRFLVLVMGPVFNMILAFGLYWFVFTVYPSRQLVYEGASYTVGHVNPESPEAAAGLLVGDVVVGYNDTKIDNPEQFNDLILLDPNKEVTLQVLRDGQTLPLTYTVEAHPKDGYGLKQFYPNIRIQIEDTLPDSAAARAGVEPGDILTGINGNPISWYNSAMVNELVSKRAPEASTFTIERDGTSRDLTLKPKLREIEGEDGQMIERWLVGISMTYEHIKRENTIKQGAITAWKSYQRDSTILFRAVYKLMTAQLSLTMMSGPIGVAQVTSEAMKRGWREFLLTVALLSLNLGIMNLLPIPVLDGGEIFVLLVEGITRKDFSLDTKMRIKMFGLVIIVALMGFVIVSDILKRF